jgi:uncharacterized protein YbjT (DUF2867 family)
MFMKTPGRRILVTGATGKQGRALIRTLLSKGHAVRALTRNPESAAAGKLRDLGAEIVGGSMEDRASVARGVSGVDAVFLVTTPFESGADAEIQQGMCVADAAKAAGVQHLVYSSVPQAQSDMSISFFKSKATVEAYIQKLGVPYTILAPSFFMENLSGPYYLPGLYEGRFAIPLSPTCKLQMIAVENVAAFAALVLEQGQQFFGQHIELASDEHTPAEIAQILSRAICRTLRLYRTPKQEVVAWSKDLAMVYDSLDRVGTRIEIAPLVRKYAEIGWQRLQAWAEAQSWGMLTGDRAEQLA